MPSASMYNLLIDRQMRKEIMGTYVYALNTKVRTVAGKTVGVAEFRYKDGWGITRSVYNRLCSRRVEHFDNAGLPDFFVMCKLEDGTALFSFIGKDGRPSAGSCFSDGISLNKVGTIRKVGRSYTIEMV